KREDRLQAIAIAAHNKVADLDDTDILEVIILIATPEQGRELKETFADVFSATNSVLSKPLGTIKNSGFKSGVLGQSTITLRIAEGAEEYLVKGQDNDVVAVRQLLPKDLQTAVFVETVDFETATYAACLCDLSTTQVMIVVPIMDNIDQLFLDLGHDDSAVSVYLKALDCLKQFLTHFEHERVIIFYPDLANNIVFYGKGMNSSFREADLETFQSGKAHILFTNDKTIFLVDDIPGISAVIVYATSVADGTCINPLQFLDIVGQYSLQDCKSKNGQLHSYQDNRIRPQDLCCGELTNQRDL
ncbi:hypothetical protein BGZ47_001200, partial [Haplosporangium gracile]